MCPLVAHESMVSTAGPVTFSPMDNNWKGMDKMLADVEKISTTKR